MRQDQLQKARQTRWRQDGNALLTLDDAERWLAETPLCLYLPRHQHLPVPAPSFVEAVAGRPDPTPGPEQIAAASQMLARLVASGAVIALNLFGAAPGIGVSSFVGEHPDFLATPEALPYLYALQPERNPKRAPTTVGGARVSPLAAEAYMLLEREGALTTVELRSLLGREVTEAAVLRSLAELWHTMRVVPVPADNPQEGAHWELLSARHRRELNIGSTQSQTTALSILVSFYLQSAIAATAEEVEIFLSPLASRSRIRDVVRGLSTTRQLASFSLAGDEQFYVEGTLPELPEEEAVPEAIAANLDAGLEQNEPSFSEAAAATLAVAPVARARQQRPERERPARGPRIERRTPRPSFGDRARGGFNPRDRGERPAPRREGGFRSPERRSFRKPESGETAAPPRRSFERTDRPRPDRPRPARSGSDGPPRREGGYRSFRKSEPGESSAPPRRSFERPDRPRSERPPRRDQPGRPPFDRERPPRREFQKPFGKGGPNRAGRPDRRSESRPEQRTDRRPQTGAPGRPQTRGGGARPEGRGFERRQEGFKPANRFGKPGGRFQRRPGGFENRSGRPSERSVRPEERSGGPSERSGNPVQRSGGPIQRSGSPGQRSVRPGERSVRPEERRGRFEDRGAGSERRGDRFNQSRGPRAARSFEGRSTRPERDARGPRDRRSGDQPGNKSGGTFRPARPFRPSQDRRDRPPRGESRGRPREDRPGQRPFSGRPPRRESQGGEQRPFRRESGRPGGDFRKPSGPKRFGAAKPGGNFKPKAKRPGGFAPPRRKPGGETGGGDEG